MLQSILIRSITFVFVFHKTNDCPYSLFWIVAIYFFPFVESSVALLLGIGYGLIFQNEFGNSQNDIQRNY